MNFALFPLVNRRDGYERNATLSQGHLYQHFGFDLKARGDQIQAGEGFQSDQAEAALAVGQWLADQVGNPVAEIPIGPIPNERHVCTLRHAIADEEVGLATIRLGDESRDIRSAMLTITVHKQGPAKAQLLCPIEPLAEGDSFALILWQGQDFDAKSTGDSLSGIG